MPALVWTPVVGHYALVKGGDTDLVIGINQRPFSASWTVIGIELLSSATTLEGVFDHHAHDIIKESATSLASAKRAAKAYGKAWLAKRPKTKRCACKTIGSKSARTA